MLLLFLQTLINEVSRVFIFMFLNDMGKIELIKTNNMNKQKIIVPEGIRFLSEWEDFNLIDFPNKCIIDKQLPGCGFTEYCIKSKENIILCSPRKLLLENKWDQHQGEVYLVRNEMDKDPDVDKDISKSSKEDLKEQKETNSDVYMKLIDEIQKYYYYCFSNNLPIKILVTYDSYRIVQQILIDMGIFQNFYTVVDEFQSILHDARFKSDTEMSFMNYLRRSHSALFVSATPMMDEYLEMLDEFRELPYYTLDWGIADPTRVIKPDLDIHLMKSVLTKAEEIIHPYLEGNFKEVIVMRDGMPVKIISNEAVIYVNSVNHIISIIKKCNLRPEQVNILCADTEDNKSRIKRRLGKEYSIGSVPLKGEKPKMFTFCTRTVYLGADFYSLCARSFILSDSNSDCLAVDISEDLPQILGRQRLFENPWKNSAEFYYRTTADYRKMSDKDFETIINRKVESTESLLRSYSEVKLDKDKYTLAKKYQKDANNSNYKDDYVAVNKIINDVTGDIILKPVINKLVLVNEIRAFKIQQIDYKDRFTVFTTVHNQLTSDDIINQEVSKFMGIYNSYTTMYDKLRILCEYGLSKDAVKIVLSQIPDSDDIKSYYTVLGPEKLYSLGYSVTKIKRALGVVVFSDDLLYDSIYSEFKVGDRLSLSFIKSKLSLIYSSVNYRLTPKANDIIKWFEIKEVSLFDKKEDGSRRRIKAYELVRSKEEELRENLKYIN